MFTFVLEKKIFPFLPKHMPHIPARIVRMNTSTQLPSWVSWKTTKAKRSTMMVCPSMTTNCVMTWEKRISVPLMPFTKERSSSPSFLSSSMAPEVNATAMKKMILENERKYLLRHCIRSCESYSTYVRTTPGAAKSVKSGLS